MTGATPRPDARALEAALRQRAERQDAALAAADALADLLRKTKSELLEVAAHSSGILWDDSLPFEVDAALAAWDAARQGQGPSALRTLLERALPYVKLAAKSDLNGYSDYDDGLLEEIRAALDAGARSG